MSNQFEKYLVQPINPDESNDLQFIVEELDSTGIFQSNTVSTLHSLMIEKVVDAHFTFGRLFDKFHRIRNWCKVNCDKTSSVLDENELNSP
jgi:restriction endonuclease